MAGFQYIRDNSPAIADIVHVEAQEVSEPVRHEELVDLGLHHRFGVAEHEAEVAQALGKQPPRGERDVLPRLAGSDPRERVLLDRQHCIVHVSHVGAEPMLSREGPRNVRRVVAELGAGNHDNHVIVLDGAVVPPQFEDRRVPPRADDGRVPYVRQPALIGGGQELGLDMVLKLGGGRRAHRRLMRLGRDFVRHVKAGDLRGRLGLAAAVDDPLEEGLSWADPHLVEGLLRRWADPAGQGVDHRSTRCPQHVGGVLGVLAVVSAVQLRQLLEARERPDPVKHLFGHPCRKQRELPGCGVCWQERTSQPPISRYCQQGRSNELLRTLSSTRYRSSLQTLVCCSR
mmetsp:Transcript_4050/g.9688  ORF Transcript_4050/g.9688 Transcript_4050/m.9688 type:complete len:343 (-) Transcript_4050:362-1390(-)